MYFNRFDIIEAYYLFLSENYDGQWSKRYQRLCKILTYYSPSPTLSIDSLSENAREIYDKLCITELKETYAGSN